MLMQFAVSSFMRGDSYLLHSIHKHESQDTGIDISSFLMLSCLAVFSPAQRQEKDLIVDETAFKDATCSVREVLSRFE